MEFAFKSHDDEAGLTGYLIVFGLNLRHLEVSRMLRANDDAEMVSIFFKRTGFADRGVS